MKVKLFTVPAWGECEAVKLFLQQYEVPFEELVVADNINNLLQMYRLTKDRRVPVCVRNSQAVVGYDLTALKKLIAWTYLKLIGPFQ